MPNQDNYIQDISDFQRGQAVWRFPDPASKLILERIKNTGFGLNSERDNLEIHLYELNTNELVKSVRVPLTENYLYIRETGDPSHIEYGLEFWNPEDPEGSLLEKYFSDVPGGYYNIVVNFFSDELGSYDDLQWKIKTISPTRGEIVIETTGQLNEEIEEDIEYFLDTSMFFDDFVALIYQLFNKATPDSIQSEMEALNIRTFNDFNASLKKYSPDGFTYLYTKVNDGYRSQYRSALKNLYNKIFLRITDYLTEQLKNNNTRITKTRFKQELFHIIEQTVVQNLNKFPEANLVTRAE